MSPTQHPDDTNAPVLLLDAELWQARMRARGFTTVVKQAQAADLSRSHLTDILKGRAVIGPKVVRQVSRAAEAKPSQVFKLADA
jgi:hypothetical protein